jgi:HEAT repeat protein
LAELGASADVASLGAVEAQLNNQDPAIRKAAVNAAVQIGSPDAIPALRNEMLYLDDPLEKAEIQKAIDFLQLPPL